MFLPVVGRAVAALHPSLGAAAELGESISTPLNRAYAISHVRCRTGATSLPTIATTTRRDPCTLCG
ncbi:MAG: hypothetical protein ABT15_16890 [Pseudonocardia sp. SCN 73-27]|nr:MAG: hypothetical protein ABS80_17345 [Pseudonocardia sp. SCN 72-51]ODV05538.1 MAG: hypothetical protein ABT15_16890 [Pseudonocardia sp. SCN 73-27]